MRIVFLAPGVFRCICGGRKVICEYSNYLTKQGHDVTILYPATDNFKRLNFKQKCRTLLAFIYYKLTKDYTPHRWFNLDKNIKQKLVWSLKQSNAPEADCYIATGVNTAPYLNEYNCPSTKKFYFIQAFEDFIPGFDEESIMKTFHYDMNRIVISSWLKKIIESEGLKCTKIPNGFNFNEFKYITDIKTRDKFSVCIYYSENGEKGVKYSIETIEIVKRLYPQLVVNMFGLCPRPSHIPEWYNYYQNPTKEEHNKIYNSSAIYIASSTVEGWGLTVGEAMMCGCAVVCTSTTGFLEMAEDGKNALVIPTKDPTAGANAVIKFIENDDYRLTIADNAIKSISQLDLKNSCKLFETEITKYKERI